MTYCTRGVIYFDMGDIVSVLADFTTACDMGNENACTALEEVGE